MTVPKIAGEWRGHYVHRGHSEFGDSFTAFISETGDRIEGTVIDDAGPGPASLTGSFSFPSVAFTKVYSRGGTYTEVEKVGNRTMTTVGVYGPPVEYEGSMTDDGKSMSGIWLINVERGSLGGAGTWTAYRVEEEEQKASKETAKRVKKKEAQVLDDLI